MLKIIGIILAFGLGYMTAYNELIAYMLQEVTSLWSTTTSAIETHTLTSTQKTALYIVMGLTASFLLIYIPLERIAEAESIQVSTDTCVLHSC